MAKSKWGRVGWTEIGSKGLDETVRAVIPTIRLKNSVEGVETFVFLLFCLLTRKAVYNAFFSLWTLDWAPCFLLLRFKYSFLLISELLITLGFVFLGHMMGPFPCLRTWSGLPYPQHILANCFLPVWWLSKFWSVCSAELSWTWVIWSLLWP